MQSHRRFTVVREAPCCQLLRFFNDGSLLIRLCLALCGKKSPTTTDTCKRRRLLRRTKLFHSRMSCKIWVLRSDAACFSVHCTEVSTF